MTEIHVTTTYHRFLLLIKIKTFLWSYCEKKLETLEKAHLTDMVSTNLNSQQVERPEG